MKKGLKSVIFICVITLLISGLLNVEASKTGHEEFSKIDFLYLDNCKLLVEMDKNEKNEIMKKVKRKAFGWSEHTNLKNIHVIYEAGNIFSRSNNTSHSIEFKYSTQELRKKQISGSLSGTTAAKISGKTTKISWGLDKTIRAEIGAKLDTSFQEETNFSIRIEPRKKVSLIVKGIATLSNGAAKYYAFGICTQKKMWEYIDIINEYYELYEESII